MNSKRYKPFKLINNNSEDIIDNIAFFELVNIAK